MSPGRQVTRPALIETAPHAGERQYSGEPNESLVLSTKTSYRVSSGMARDSFRESRWLAPEHKPYARRRSLPVSRRHYSA